ncbi:MAG: C25 family cysteine peptidase [bacterium]
MKKFKAYLIFALIVSIVVVSSALAQIPKVEPISIDTSILLPAVNITNQVNVNLLKLLENLPPSALNVSLLVKDIKTPANLRIAPSFQFELYPLQKLGDFVIASQLSRINLHQVEIENEVYRQISLEGREGFVGGTIGEAALPMFKKIVAIPKGAKIQVEVVKGEPSILSSCKVAPVRKTPADQIVKEPRIDERIDEKIVEVSEFDITEPPVISKEYYSQNRLLPEQLYSLRYDTIRGCNVAVITVTAAQYNPAQDTLLLYPDISLNVSFSDGKDKYIPPENRSLYFEPVYKSVLANYSLIERLEPETLLEVEQGIYVYICNLLIITPEEFEDQAHDLADWKVSKGLHTWVRTLAQIQEEKGGTSADHIRSYIKDIYTHNALSYVILLGDTEDIPTFYRNHPCNWNKPPGSNTGQLATDLYYAEMDYSGYYTDLALGRIPVNSATEAQRVVDRIISYEQNPPTDSSFYENIILGAYFQDDYNNGQADRAYVKTIQELYSFFIGKGYNVQREYVTNSSDPQYYMDGSPIPAELQKPGYPWDGSGSDIVTALNSGAILVAHRDHGGQSGWSHPGFTTSHLASLNSGDLSPVVFSINCQTGWFDNETDPYSSTGVSDESFAEELLTMEGGAVTVIAATRDTPTWGNDNLIRALVEFIWPDFYFTPSASIVTPSARLGDVLNCAKYYVDTKHDSTVSEAEFQLYHILGDPTLQLYTQSPHILQVYPWWELAGKIQRIPIPEPGPGPYAIAEEYVIPTPGDNILVSLIKDGEIIGQALSKNNEAVIPLRQALTTLENAEISYNRNGDIQLVQIPELMPTLPSAETCVTASDYYSAPQSALARIDLGDIYVTEANLPNQNRSPLHVEDCYGNDGDLDIVVPWSESTANPPAIIHFAQEICGGKAPMRAEVTLQHGYSCTLYAIDESGAIVDLDIAIGGAGIGTQTLVLESPKGIRLIEIEGAEICITRICVSCEEGPSVSVEECACEKDNSGILNIEDVSGRAGEIISIPVMIQNAPNIVHAFGFDIQYNATALKYIEYQEGSLAHSFDFFSVVKYTNGRLRAGGVDSEIDDESILSGSEGTLLILQFEVLSEIEECSYPLQLENLEDDMINWPSSGGCFTVVSRCSGDLNGDGAITSGDALIAFKCYMSSDGCIPCTDVTGDGKITPADALCIFNRYMGLPSCLD